MNLIVKKIGKLSAGILIGFGIEIVFGFIVSDMIQKISKTYVDGQPYIIYYPLLTALFIGGYLVFRKKQYLITIGMFLGILTFILSLGILLEIGMSL